MAVLTIDPSSHVTGGSILGDKSRMTLLSREPEAYVRASPSGGAGRAEPIHGGCGKEGMAAEKKEEKEETTERSVLSFGFHSLQKLFAVLKMLLTVYSS